MLKVLVLGTGCKNCHLVEERAKQAVSEMGLDADVQLVTEMQTIMRYGVMQTPALVIDEKVVSTGRVPATSQIKELLGAASAQG